MREVLPISDLIIIEAPGKRSRVQSAVNSLGFRAPVVFATKGSLLDLPEEHIAVHPATLKATEYRPINPAIYADLRAHANQAERIWVMTDNDREGEVIAAQVRFAIGFREVHRVRVRSLTHDSITQAFAAATPMNNALVAEGMTRRIVDRILGYGFSDPKRPDWTGIVGRVLTGTLAVFRHHAVPCARLGGRTANGYSVQALVTAETLKPALAVARLLARQAADLDRLPHRKARVEIAPPPPCTGADALLMINRRLGLSTKDASARMQSLYEAGRLSYIRTDSRYLGSHARHLSVELLRANRGRIAKDWQTLYAEPAAGMAGAHEGLHPTEMLDLTHDPAMLSPDDGILNLIGRRLAAALSRPAVTARSIPDPQAFSEWVRENTGVDLDTSGLSVEIHRDDWEQIGWRLLYAEPEQEIDVRRMSQDEIILGAMLQSGLGRPSTYTDMVDTIKRRGFVRDDATLTARGVAAYEFAAAHAPFLTNLAKVSRIDTVIPELAMKGLPIEQIVQQTLKEIGLPPDTIKQVIERWEAPKTRAAIVHQADKARDLTGKASAPAAPDRSATQHSPSRPADSLNTSTLC